MNRFVGLGSRKTIQRSGKGFAPTSEVFHFWFVKDDYNQKFRVGRSGWPNDTFEMLPTEEFEQLKIWAARFGIQVKDLDQEEQS